jgi:hypothetical protein
MKPLIFALWVVFAFGGLSAPIAGTYASADMAGAVPDARRTKLPVTGWPQLVETWLGTIGMIPK